MLLRRTIPGTEPRRGVVLIAVLVVVVLLSLAAYQYSELMMAEYKASVSFTRAAQARALADSGTNYAALLLSDPNAFANSLGSNPYDNPSFFREIVVANGLDGSNPGYFSVVAPLGPEESSSTNTAYRFGVTDESGKINLNTLLRYDRTGGVAVRMLGTVGIPEETANAILDWIDSDVEPRSGGAEIEYYSLQGYEPRNGPLETIEELLYVRGVTPELLFGNDTNRNGVLDADEGGTGGQLNLGWQAYLTVYSREQNVDELGNRRIYINTRSTLSLYSKLVEAVGEEMAHYILAYRRYGAASQTTVPQNVQRKEASELTREELGLSIYNRRARNLSSIYELIGTEIEIPGSGEPRGPATRVACPLNDEDRARELLPTLLTRLTTTSREDLPARININTAPRAVLMALPGLTESDVEAIMATRPVSGALQGPEPIYQCSAWLYTEARLKPQSLRSLDRFITARTQVYRMQVVGHFANGGPTVRVEAIVDTNRGRPRFVYWRDLSELGRGFNLPVTGNGMQ